MHCGCCSCRLASQQALSGGQLLPSSRQQHAQMCLRGAAALATSDQRNACRRRQQQSTTACRCTRRGWLTAPVTCQHAAPRTPRSARMFSCAALRLLQTPGSTSGRMTAINSRISSSSIDTSSSSPVGGFHCRSCLPSRRSDSGCAATPAAPAAPPPAARHSRRSRLPRMAARSTGGAWWKRCGAVSSRCRSRKMF